MRIDEVYAYDGLMADPATSPSCTTCASPASGCATCWRSSPSPSRTTSTPFIEEVKGLQDLLGDIHDCDVQIPMLEGHLAWLTGREGGAARRLVAQTRRPARVAGRRRGAGSEAAFRAFQRAARRRAAAATSAPGVHALIARRRRERDELYARFVDEWRRLKARAVPPAPRGRAGDRGRPERLALMGDIHANLPPCGPSSTRSSSRGHRRAARSRATWSCAAPDPEGVVEEVRRLGWPCVVGNTDRKVGGAPGAAADHPKARAGGLARVEHQPA